MLSAFKGIFGSTPTIPLYVDGRKIHRGKCNAVGKKRPCDCKEYERIDNNKCKSIFFCVNCIQSILLVNTVGISLQHTKTEGVGIPTR